MRSVSVLSKRSFPLGCACLVIALAAAGCGRRGALEAPGGAPAGSGNAVIATPTTLATRPSALVTTSPDGDEEAASSTFVSPQPNPVRRGRAYTVPNTPFILDPLL